MNILVWFWSGGGGGSQFAVHLAHRLGVQFGKDAVSLSLRADDPTAESAEARGVRVRRANVVSNRKQPLATALRLAGSAGVLREHIEAARADVVVLAMNFAAAAPLAFTLRAPLVYCAHDPEPHPGDYEMLGQKLTQGALLKRADIVVALSRYAAGMLERKALRKPVRIAPLSSVFEPVTRAESTSEAPTRLLFIGRMIAYKGLELLAQCLPRIANRQDWRLTVAGEGPALDAELKARLAAFPQIDVRCGFLSESEIDALIDAHHVLLAPYISATQSGVVSQALARGRPVLATPVGALPEQIGGERAGWLAQSANVDAFAARLIEVLDDSATRAAKEANALALAREVWDAPCWDWLADVARARF